MTFCWQKKLAEWWATLALQQVSSKVEVERAMFTEFRPPTKAVAFTPAREPFDLHANQEQPAIKTPLISKKEYLSPPVSKASSSSLNDRLATVSEPKANPPQQVANNCQQVRAPEVLETISTPIKKRIPSNTSKNIPAASTITKTTFEPVPNDFDWGSSPND